MGSKTITGIVSWLKGWFYDKTEIDGKVGSLTTAINNKASQSDLNTTNSNLSALQTTVSGKANSVHSHNTGEITNASALSNLGTNQNATQSTINSAINTKIGELSGVEVDVIKIVADKGDASASTMNKLYIVSENNKVNVYYTVKNGSTYSWEKLDDNILDELSISWNDLEDVPSTFTPSSHTHGNITNVGAIGTTANLPIITTTSGKLTTGKFGASTSTSATEFVACNDSRLSNARTPTSHTHGAIQNGGTLNSDTTTVSKVVVTDGSNNIKTISKIPSANVTHQDISGKINTSAIKNDLTTGGATNVLSAEQGKVLNTKITTLEGKVIDWDTLEFVPKSEDDTGAITFDYL